MITKLLFHTKGRVGCRELPNYCFTQKGLRKGVLATAASAHGEYIRTTITYKRASRELPHALRMSTIRTTRTAFTYGRASRELSHALRVSIMIICTKGRVGNCRKRSG